MYTDLDFTNTKREMWKRVLLFSAFALVLLAGNIVLIRLRLLVPSMLGAGFAFVICFFVWSFKVLPWVKYYRFLRDMRAGQRRKTDCEFVSVSEETLMRDGVEVRQFITKVGEAEEDERLYYWDVEKPMPSIAPGQKLSILSYGNAIVELNVTGGVAHAE